jgi:hypothetical protein
MRCSDSKFSPSEKFIADNTLVGEIKENMTMKEVIQSLGNGCKLYIEENVNKHNH